MTKDQLPALTSAVARAIEAGKAAAEAAPNDGGSANLDRAYIRVGLLREGSLHKAGLEGWMQPASTYHARAFHLGAPFGGQGNRRYAGVQAMYKSLKAEGVDCGVWYQTD
ncbi:hypothetical protein [Pseudomonas fluorescens]|uniref:Uncharacterized protein n=1 Tax=Pseudomonas fluorescens TaxID=294 RepID=A0A5E7RXK6_PSEFL|nr:hypothetical protein [Pseudomonas fluorescens]VVP79056.1 hypothetical protein PS928_00538 [Pseudomonas fluorescens]